MERCDDQRGAPKGQQGEAHGWGPWEAKGKGFQGDELRPQMVKGPRLGGHRAERWLQQPHRQGCWLPRGFGGVQRPGRPGPAGLGMFSQQACPFGLEKEWHPEPLDTWTSGSDAQNG